MSLSSGRFAPIIRLLAVIVGLNLLLRLALIAFNGDWTLFSPAWLAPILGIGLLFDVAAAVWFLCPFLLLAALWPAGPRAGRWFARATSAGLFVLCIGLAFVAAAEFVFWNEFTSRFNFIAVDYLIYTREVIGNIRESYDLRPMLVGVVVTGLLLYVVHRAPLRRAAADAAPGRRARWAALAAAVALPVASFIGVDPRFKEFGDDAQAAQLAGNGPYEFFSAFRNNEIDYAQFYRTLPAAQGNDVLRAEYSHVRDARYAPGAAMPIEREVSARGEPRRLNVVLVSVESLSANFLGSFGNRDGLTPNLDALTREGMLFTQVYATGLRTVRGLEAISMSIPPTPGNSIVKRPGNDDMLTIGEIFREKGYESLYIYGGYGYFDNMSAFFSGNGYTVVDRTAIDKSAIHYENIWGVADEDLFTLTLDQLDTRHAAGKPFFAHVMTTSNHRPFTYPAGRIDMPSGTGRKGAVKYTDWALGDFIRRARAHPWFDNTVFVILADHTAEGRGKVELDPANFHIPLLIWSPRHVAPARIETLASQIDVAPTLLGLLNFGYRSKFFGQDIITDAPEDPRAFIANYQAVGFIDDGLLVELRPGRRVRVVDMATGKEHPPDEESEEVVGEAISYYQSAAHAFRSGSLKRGGTVARAAVH